MRTLLFLLGVMLLSSCNRIDVGGAIRDTTSGFLQLFVGFWVVLVVGFIIYRIICKLKGRDEL